MADETLPPGVVPLETSSEEQLPPGVVSLESQPDILGRAKEYLTQEPPPGARSMFGEPETLAPVGAAIRAAGRFMLPGSLPEAGLQAGLGYLGGKLIPPVVSGAASAFKAMRPLTKETARETLAEMLPGGALAAKGFYEAAEQSGREIPLKSIIRIGRDKIESEVPHTFREAQDAVQTLRGAANILENKGRTAAAATARQHIADMENTIERTFPGYKEAQKGYAKLKDIGAVQEFVNKSDPLRSFEASLATGQVVGPTGTILLKGSSRAGRFLNPAEVKDAKDILTKLGPEPGNNIFRQMVEGRAVGGAIGGALGYQHGGASGAAEGAALGIAGPAAINWIITQSLKHPVTRAFLKRSLEGKGGLSNPHTWQMLSMLGERIGMQMQAPQGLPQ